MKAIAIKTTAKAKLVPLVVTTLHKGVFYGWGIRNGDKSSIKLERAQMCVYWSADVRGVFGLAVTGPSAACKISPPVDSMDIFDVTAVAQASPEADRAWKVAGERKWV